MRAVEFAAFEYLSKPVDLLAHEIGAPARVGTDDACSSRCEVNSSPAAPRHRFILCITVP